MKVAAVQFKPTLGDKQGNLRKLAALVIEAAQNEAQLIVLPELAANGYSFMSKEEALPQAENISEFSPPGDPNTSLGIMYALAKKYRVHIAWGLIERNPHTGNLYNSQVLMTPTGQFETYAKVNFFANDHLWASEGRSNPPIRTCDFDGEAKKVGLLICRDVRDKKDDSWSSFYESGDADLVCLSSNWGKGAYPANAWMDFVKENKTTLVVSNRWGVETPNDFGDGGVCVIEPSGKVHCEGLLWSQDCIVYAEV